jgi:integrase
MTKIVKIGPYRVAPHKRAGRLTGRWILDIPKSIAGRRQRPLFDTCELATQAAKDLLRGFAHEALSGLRVNKSRQSISFSEAEEQWLVEQERRVEARKKCSSSLERDKWNLEAAKAFFGNIALDQITSESLEKFQVWRLKKGRKPDTVNSDTQMVCKLLRWAYRRQLLDRVPIVDPVPSDAGRNLLVPTREEVVRIIDALPKYNRLVVRFIAETGSRSGEVFSLKWENLDLENRIAHYRRTEEWSPKTRHSERAVAFSEATQAELMKLPIKTGFVFASPKAPGKRRDNVRKSLLTAVNKANVMRNGKRLRVTLHTLRKCYATWGATEERMPHRQLQDQLGHAPGSKMTLKHYVGRSRDLLQQCVMPLPIVSLEGEVATTVATH